MATATTAGPFAPTGVLFPRRVRTAHPLRLSFALLCAFIFLLYASLPTWIPIFEQLRPAQVTAILGLICLVVESTTARQGLRLVWPEAPLLLAFFSIGLLSIGTSLWPGLAIDTMTELGRCVAVFFIISQSVTLTRRLKALMWTMVLGGLFPAFGTILFYFKGLTEYGRSVWLGLFGNPNDDAYALVLLVPLAYGLAAVGGWKARLVAGASILVYAFAIYTTFSRGGLFGLLAAIVVIGLRVRSIWMKVFGGAVIGLALVAMSYFWSRQDGFEQLGSDATFSQRLITVRAGLGMLADHPILGVGPGNSVVAFDNYVSYNDLTKQSLMVHNTFVEALAETGLLGGLSYLALSIAALLGAHRLAAVRGPSPAERERATLATAIFASLVGFVVCGMSGPYVFSWFPFLLFGLVAASRRIAEAAPDAATGEAA